MKDRRSMAKCLPEKTRALVRQVQWQVPNQRIIPSLTEEYDQICNYKREMLCDPVCHAVECSTKHTRGLKEPLRNARLLVLSTIWNGNCSRVGECRQSV
jgi:hypothetical protein